MGTRKNSPPIGHEAEIAEDKGVVSHPFQFVEGTGDDEAPQDAAKLEPRFETKRVKQLILLSIAMHIRIFAFSRDKTTSI